MICNSNKTCFCKHSNDDQLDYRQTHSVSVYRQEKEKTSAGILWETETVEDFTNNSEKEKSSSLKSTLRRICNLPD